MATTVRELRLLACACAAVCGAAGAEHRGTLPVPAIAPRLLCLTRSGVLGRTGAGQHDARDAYDALRAMRSGALFPVFGVVLTNPVGHYDVGDRGDADNFGLLAAVTQHRRSLRRLHCNHVTGFGGTTELLRCVAGQLRRLAMPLASVTRAGLDALKHLRHLELLQFSGAANVSATLAPVASQLRSLAIWAVPAATLGGALRAAPAGMTSLLSVTLRAFGDADDTDVAGFVACVLATARALRSVTLRDGTVTSGILAALQPSRTVTRLDATDVYFPHVPALADCLRAMTQLRWLDLSRAVLLDARCASNQRVVDAVAGLPELRYFAAVDNGWGDHETELAALPRLRYALHSVPTGPN
jgi:hypothetical protein